MKSTDSFSHTTYLFFSGHDRKPCLAVQSPSAFQRSLRISGDGWKDQSFQMERPTDRTTPLIFCARNQASNEVFQSKSSQMFSFPDNMLVFLLKNRSRRSKES